MDRYGRGMISFLHELDLSRQLSNPIRKRDPATAWKKEKEERKRSDQPAKIYIRFFFSISINFKSTSISVT